MLLMICIIKSILTFSYTYICTTRQLEFANHALSIPKGRSDHEDENYGNTGYGVSSPGIKN